MPTPGPLELVIILVIALLILGPGKLPEVGSALGKSIREFRKASADVQDAVKVNVDTSPQPNAPSVQAAPSTAAPAEPTPATYTQAEVEARVAAAVAAAKADAASTVTTPSADSTSTAH
jgi:TatA/E family protein of Tat protein translocase